MRYISSPPLFGFSLLFSHDLRHEIAHLFGCAFLHLPCDVGVGAQCEACIKVTEHAGHRFYVHAVLQYQGRECVPLRYNYDKPEKPRILCLLRRSFCAPVLKYKSAQILQLETHARICYNFYKISFVSFIPLGMLHF